MDVDRILRRGFEIIQPGREMHIRGPYIIHSGKSISGEYSAQDLVTCSHQGKLVLLLEENAHFRDDSVKYFTK